MTSAAAPSLFAPDEGPSIPRWAIAAVVVTLAHAGLAWWLIHTHDFQTPASGAPAAVLIELAPLSVAPAQPAPDAAPGPEMTRSEPEEVKPETPPEPLPPEPTPPPPEPTPEPAPIVPPPVVPPPELPPVPKPDVVLAPAPKPPPPVKIERHPTKELRRKPVARREPKRESKPPAPRTSAPPRARAAAAPSRGAPEPRATAGSSLSAAAWRSELMAQLNRNQHYPEAARERGERGTASLSFTIDRRGNVVGAHLAGSSGSADLDRETLAMIHRASPLPAPPPEIGGARINLTVPIRFNLR